MTTIFGLISFLEGHMASSVWCLHVSPLGIWLLWVFFLGGMMGVDLGVFLILQVQYLKLLQVACSREDEKMKGFVSSSFIFPFCPLFFILHVFCLLVFKILCIISTFSSYLLWRTYKKSWLDVKSKFLSTLQYYP